MKKSLTIVLPLLVAALCATCWLRAQNPEEHPTFRVKVDMVVLTFTIVDTKGKYVNGLKPKDLKVFEDEIPQKLATFTEGNRPPLQVLNNGDTKSLAAGETGAPTVDLRSDVQGTNVFVLFDTSNYMYRGFVYASDAISDFIRGLDRADSVAVYTYSRNLNRAVVLNRDRTTAIAGLRKAVAGDDSALYNCLLLTLRDAARVPGRKVVIVFSNGPDNASMVAPDDVRAVAEDEGIPIYVISTSEVTKDPISSSIFKRISAQTGGKSYFAKTWQKQVEAFEAIREDLGNSYTVTYYPQPNPNEGFRKISIELTSDQMKKYKVRARPGYRPQRGF
ncbi:MAG TPA: VWA domain-containing protein [Bryobacteraceae bacterium]|nr:VWA domain-containing protein [Bryobacteraceae bacterium]